MLKIAPCLLPAVAAPEGLTSTSVESRSLIVQWAPHNTLVVGQATNPQQSNSVSAFQ